jgi:hypothetical protein
LLLYAGASLHLPTETRCLRVWEVLSGSVQQRRVWTFGRRAPDGADASTPAVSSAEPLSIRGGVVFVSCAAGRAHSAAADGAGHVYTWGANEAGQCGVAKDAAPVISHALPADVGDETSVTGDAASRRLTKLDSLALLASSVRLPPSLLQSLKQQQALHRQQQQALEANAQIEAVPEGCAAAEADGASARQLHVYRVTIGQAVHMVACGAVSRLRVVASQWASAAPRHCSWFAQAESRPEHSAANHVSLSCRQSVAEN